MVSVLATAHMHPASTAQTIRCGAWRTSLLTCAVPRMNAGTLQRARKTPSTMMKETVIGEMSGLTSLMGASAPPSQAPAAKPQKMPRACRLRRGAWAGVFAGATAWAVPEGEFNGACPEGKGRREEPSAESRSGDRSELRGTDYWNRRPGSETLQPRNGVC